MRAVNVMEMNGTCFLSPHSDDISMSGFFVIKEEILPRPYYLFTVFGESEYVDRHYKNHPIKSEITSIRLEEDLRFAKMVDLEFIFLKEPDCWKRFNRIIQESSISLDFALIERIFSLVFSQLSKLNIKNIVVPYPFGRKQHYDHRITFEVAQKLSIEANLNLYYLDDLPYSIAKMGANLIDIIYSKKMNTEDLQAKYAIMNIYKSQMCEYFYKSIKNAGGERLFKIKKANLSSRIKRGVQ